MGGGRSGESGVASPCVRACRLDPAGGLCGGCLRSVAEIARWGDADDAERARILAAVAARRSVRGGASPGGDPPAGTDVA